jgi:RNA polymerase sigma-70 factor (ECF subfamily)
MTDTLLITGLQQGGAERRKYENELYLTYNYFIGEGCNKYNLTEDESFSAYSDAVLSVIQNITSGRFEGRSSIKTYLFQIFSNKCVDLVRKNTTNKSSVNQGIGISEMMTQLPDAARNVVDKMMQKYQLGVLAAKLKEIGEKCRDMLLMFEEGFTDREIAEKLQYQTAAVAKTTRLRCLDKLREKVKAEIA